MNIHRPSIIKAAGFAVLAILILAILSLVLDSGPAIAISYCIGGFAIPIGSGLLYGAFSPGEGDMGEGALGGAITGIISGVLYGFILGIGTVIIDLIDGAAIGPAMTGGVLSFFFSFCGFAVTGFVFGAVGGMLWAPLKGQMAS